MSLEYELIPHTADLKIRAFGVTEEELFKNALKGMFSCAKPRSKMIRYDGDNLVIKHYTHERSIVVRSSNVESLLVDFLSECLYLSDTHDEAYFDARFTLFSPTELEATLFGVSVIGFDGSEIKAVTYHDLSLEQIEGTWQTTLVFDI